MFFDRAQYGDHVSRWTPPPTPAQPFQDHADISSAEKCRRVARQCPVLASSAGLLFRPGFPTLSSLLAVAMIQKFSLPEKFRSVSRTAYGDEEQRVRKLNLRGPVARLLAKTAVGTPRPPLSQYKTCDQLQSVNRRSTTIAGAISKRLGPGSIGKTS
jgi:hypothetical protein